VLDQVQLMFSGRIFVTPDLGDWALDGGAQASLARWRDLRVALALGPVLRKSADEAFSSWGIGAAATLLARYEGPRRSTGPSARRTPS